VDHRLDLRGCESIERIRIAGRGTWGAGRSVLPEECTVPGSYRYKPSKPAAVIQILVGIAMLVLAITSFAHKGFNAFFVVWCLILVGIVGLNAWAGFSKNGSLATFSRVPDDDSR
jgi:hypothetical protein